MGFVKVGNVSDVPAGRVGVYVVDDREIAVCNVDGTIYAIDNLCTHDDGSLDQGDLDGCEIECPRHGARFNVTTGKATMGPAFLPVDTFPIRVEGDEIKIEV